MTADAKSDKARRLVIDDLGLIDGNVHNLRNSRDNANVLCAKFNMVVDHNVLLRRSNEVAEVARQQAQTLNRLHEVIRLSDKCLAKLLCPLEIGIHVLKHTGIVSDRLHAGIPILRIDLLFGGTAANELGCTDDIKRVGRCRKNLCQ